MRPDVIVQLNARTPTLSIGARFFIDDTHGVDDRVPDAKTVWLYREALAGMVEALFKQFDGHLARQGYIAGLHSTGRTD